MEDIAKKEGSSDDVHWPQVKEEPAEYCVRSTDAPTVVKEELDIGPTVLQRVHYNFTSGKPYPREDQPSELSLAASSSGVGDARARTPSPSLSRKAPSSRSNLFRMAVGERRNKDNQAAHHVDRTLSGSLRRREDDRPLIGTTPGGTVRRVHARRSLAIWEHPEERGDVAQIPDDEVDELLLSDRWQLERWLEDLPREPITKSSTAGDADEVHNPVDAAPSANQQCAAAFGEVCGVGGSTASSSTLQHLHPPLQRATSPVAGPSGERSCGMGRVYVRSENGSEFDSEFDDEFDAPDRFAPTPGGTEWPSAAVADEDVAAVMAEAEEAIDNDQNDLPGVDFNFEWTHDYNSYRGARGIFTGGPAGPIRSFDTPYDAFVAIWDESIMQTIAKQTAEYAWHIICENVEKGTLTESQRLNEWVEPNIHELYVLFAMYIIMGFTPRLRLDDYWKTSRFFDNPGIRSVMSYNRYILLNKFLHFVDPSDSVLGDRKRLSKLQPIIDHCNAKFQELYVLGEHVSIDKSLTLWKGRLSWAQCIRTKAGRFGIKSFELCESLTGYLWRFVIYTGKGSAQFPSSVVPDIAGKTTAIVLELLKGLEFKGYYLTIDNFCNSPILSRYLKKKGFDCVAGHKHVPDAVKLKKSAAAGTLVSQHCGNVSITSWKDSKVASTISTFHNARTYDTTKREKGRGVVPITKPIVVHDFNRYMGGIDLKDQKLAMYLMERKKGVKWYIKMFKRLLNVSVHNAYVLHRQTAESQNRRYMTHRQFRENLATALVDKHAGKEPRVRKNPTELRLRTDVFHCPEKTTHTKRKLCARCSARIPPIKRRVTSVCGTCGRGLCIGECWRDYHTKTDLK